MVDLKEFKKRTTLQTIADVGQQTTEHRPYLGMSQIGHSCERYLWYSFRWCYQEILSARILRLFERGHREEPAVIKALESAGIRVWGDQTEISTCHGHCKGHNDGICLGVIEAPKTEHLLEIKTMSDKYFKEMKKSGLKVSKPIYYAQMQMYMKHLKLKRGLFISVNKNDDDLYIERVYPDNELVKELERKAESIIFSELPPKKKYISTWYECKYCSAKNICHNGEYVEITCRTCECADLLPDGEWECAHHGISLSTGQQRLACSKYSILKGL
ncbi:MAG: oxidoreductase [Bacteroidetes bacterium]|nr:oxidoreductase [Bacteroidota bacterium]